MFFNFEKNIFTYNYQRVADSRKFFLASQILRRLFAFYKVVKFSHSSLLFLLQHRLQGFPGPFPDTSNHTRFYFFIHYLVFGSVRQIKLTYVSFRAHVKLASHILGSRITPTPVRGTMY